MLRPPPIQHFLGFPVTAGFCFSATFVSLWYWNGGDIERIKIDFLTWQSEPWQLLSSTLPHGDPMHLIFNLYWTWAFGTLVERVFGSGRTLAIYAVLAAGSGLAEFAFYIGGIGLSGVGYGLAGMLWVLCRRDSRFYGAVDQSTIKLFAGWFLFCILMTYTHVMAVANVAHGAGAALGIILGWAITAKSFGMKSLRFAALGLVLLATLGAATFGRPYINCTSYGRRQEGFLAAQRAGDLLKQNEYVKAEKEYRLAVSLDQSRADSWFNLGLTYQRLKMPHEASAAFRKSYELEPDDPQFKDAAEATK